MNVNEPHAVQGSCGEPGRSLRGFDHRAGRCCWTRCNNTRAPSDGPPPPYTEKLRWGHVMYPRICNFLESLALHPFLSVQLCCHISAAPPTPQEASWWLWQLGTCWRVCRAQTCPASSSFSAREWTDVLQSVEDQQGNTNWQKFVVF